MSKHNVLFPAIFIAIAVAAIIATASVSAQSTTDDSPLSSLPVSIFIDHAMSAHEQDIKDRMLDYELNHTTSESARANIVKERSDELNAVALDQQAFLEVLKNDTSRGLIPGDRLNAMLNVTKNSIKRISISSEHLQEKAQKIKGHDASRTVDPLNMNINTASSLADNITSGNANKGIGTQDMPPKHPDNPKNNK